jgi:hypothetical protein
MVVIAKCAQRFQQAGRRSKAVRSEGTNNSPKECKDPPLNHLELLESASMSMICRTVEERQSMMDSNGEAIAD